MAFKLFKKNCPICGIVVKKEEKLNRFGKYFCTEEHAEEYRQKLAKEESERASGGGGCC